MKHFVGVVDARMVRIYRMIGASPEVLGSTGDGREKISVRLWSFSDEARVRVAQKNRDFCRTFKALVRALLRIKRPKSIRIRVS